MKIETKINRVPFATESGSGWWQILVTDAGKCTGTLSWQPQVGEMIELDGEWTVYNGEKEYKFKHGKPVIPVDEYALLSYACELTTGFGDALRDKIWQTYVEAWRELTTDLPGVTESKLADFRITLEIIELNRIQSETISYLMSKNCTQTVAAKAWEHWQQEALGKIQGDCFVLTELPQIGFANIDNGIRQAFGIGDTDTRRINAGILYAFRQTTCDGSTLVDYTILRRESCKYLQVKSGMIDPVAVALVEARALMMLDPEQPMIALARDFENEEMIWNYCGEN